MNIFLIFSYVICDDWRATDNVQVIPMSSFVTTNYPSKVESFSTTTIDEIKNHFFSLILNVDQSIFSKFLQKLSYSKKVGSHFVKLSLETDPSDLTMRRAFKDSFWISINNNLGNYIVKYQFLRTFTTFKAYSIRDFVRHWTYRDKLRKIPESRSLSGEEISLVYKLLEDYSKLAYSDILSQYFIKKSV